MRGEADVFFVIDAGTQSIRSALVDTQGNVERLAKVAIERYFSAEPGWAEQRPEYYWEKLCESSRQLLAESGVDRQRLLALAITTQRGTVINADREGRPLRPAILWIDQRLAEVGAWPPAWIRLALRADQIADLADALGVTADYLVGRDDSPRKNGGPGGRVRRVFEAVAATSRRRFSMSPRPF